MDGIVVLIVVLTGVFVYFDAKAIGAERGLTGGFLDMGPIGWGLSCILLWIVSLPLYLIQRPKIKAAAQGEPTTSENMQEVKQRGLTTAAKYIALGWTFFCLVGVIAGIIEASKSVPSSNEYAAAGYAIGTTIGLGIWFGVWLFITIPATIVYLVTKRNVAPVVVEYKAQVTDDIKKCPFCAETIKKEAVFCRYCNKDLKETVSSNTTAPKKPSKDWYKEARQLFKNENYIAAIQAFDRAIEDNPTGQFYYQRAVTHSKVRNKDKMMADLKTAANFGNQAAKTALEKMNRTGT